MPNVSCEYCSYLAAVCLRFDTPIKRVYADGREKEMKVIYVCATHCVHSIMNEKTNVVDIIGVCGSLCKRS